MQIYCRDGFDKLIYASRISEGRDEIAPTRFKNLHVLVSSLSTIFMSFLYFLKTSKFLNVIIFQDFHIFEFP